MLHLCLLGGLIAMNGTECRTQYGGIVMQVVADDRLCLCKGC